MPSVTRGITNEKNKAKNAHTARAKPTTGTCEPPWGPASPEAKTLTEGVLSDHGRRHLDDRGGRVRCGDGGVHLGALPCNVRCSLECTEPADFREFPTSRCSDE